MSLIVAVDGGQTQVRIAVRLDGVERAAHDLPGLHYGDDGDGVRTVTGLLDVIERRLPRAQLPAPVDTFVLALSGMPAEAAAHARIADEIHRRYRAARQIITSDMPAAYAGAIGTAAGAVISAGSGAIALALDGGGAARIGGGGGALLGDDGSGYWIGLMALREAWRVHTGRPGSAELHYAATQRYGPIGALPGSLRRSRTQVGDIAAFTPDVVATAAAGDPVAMGILAEAGAHLAAILGAAVTGVFGDDGPADPALVASWNGRLLRLPCLHAAFAEHLGRLFPALQVVPPAGTALDGAFRLAQAQDLTAFGRHVSLAASADGARTTARGEQK